MLDKVKEKIKKTIIPSILILIASLGYFFINFVLDEGYEATMELLFQLDILLVIFMIIFLIIFYIVLMFFICLSKWKQKFIIKSIINFFYTILIPSTVLILVFLGCLHSMYGYESTMSEDLDQTFGQMGLVFTHLYNYGEELGKQGFRTILFVSIFGICYYIWDTKELYFKLKNQINNDERGNE